MSSSGETPRPPKVGPRVVVVGAGIAGLMSAFQIMRLMPQALVTVIEKGRAVPNPYGTSTRSAACSRQQFGCELNVRMSMYSTRFYEQFESHTGEQSQMFWQKGYLFMHRDPARWNQAQSTVLDQQRWGLADVRALSSDDVKTEFPFAYTDKLLGATFCPTDGFLDPGIILTALKDWLVANGAMIMTKTEVEGFDSVNGRITAVLTNNGVLLTDYVVNATGAWASRIGKMLGTDMPVAPEKRYLWHATFRNPADEFVPQIYQRMPFMVLNDKGLTPYVKPNPGVGSNSFTIGCEHEVEPEWDFEDERQDHVDPLFKTNVPDGYVERVWSQVVDWLPWSDGLGFHNHVNGGFYETTKHHSPVIGFDPNHANLVHCCGFSGHGIMHGPAAGLVVAELLATGGYQTFPLAARDLTYDSMVNDTREVEGMKI